MPRIVIIQDGNTNMIGSPRTIPAGGVTAISELVGGATNAEIANNFLADIEARYRALIAQKRRAQAVTDGQAAISAAEGSIEDDWPV
jgi:hypothetical protein